MLVNNPNMVEIPDIIALALAARNCVDRIYLHWTAGHYGQFYDDYHFNIDKDGTVYQTCENLCESKSHTWQRNRRSIGIALACGYGASVSVPLGTCEKMLYGVKAGVRRRPLLSAEIDYGKEGPTVLQIESAARVIALLCQGLALQPGAEQVMTHAEAAIADGYGPCSGDGEMRWDLWFLPDLTLTDILLPGGEVLRGKAAWYIHSLEKAV